MDQEKKKLFGQLNVRNDWTITSKDFRIEQADSI